MYILPLHNYVQKPLATYNYSTHYLVHHCVCICIQIFLVQSLLKVLLYLGLESLEHVRLYTAVGRLTLVARGRVGVEISCKNLGLRRFCIDL